MASIAEPDNAKLICGMISSQENLFDSAQEQLESLYGAVCISSEIIPFDFTNYYYPQMGDGLLRKFIAFDRLIDPSELSDIKRATNDIEAELARGGPVERPINLDPGYITLANLVLGSMKNFSHRIYLNHGVFAEVTMMYRNGWESLEWTFPDYASGLYFPFLTAARDALRDQLKQERIKL
jgi:hypothetical protein